MTSTPARVGVLGGGRMGAGIAHAFLLAGSRVTVIEREEIERAGGETAASRSSTASLAATPACSTARNQGDPSGLIPLARATSPGTPSSDLNQSHPSAMPFAFRKPWL